MKKKGTLDLLSQVSGVFLCWIVESFDGKRKTGFKPSETNILDNNTMEAVIELGDDEDENGRFIVNTLVNNKVISSKEVVMLDLFQDDHR